MKFKRNIGKLLTILAIATAPTAAYAQQPPRIDGLVDVFDNALAMVLPIGGLIAVGMIIYGGYMWMFSEGDPGKLKQAQGVITWAIIGLVFLGLFGTLLFLYFDFLK